MTAENNPEKKPKPSYTSDFPPFMAIFDVLTKRMVYRPVDQAGFDEILKELNRPYGNEFTRDIPNISGLPEGHIELDLS